MVGRRHGSSQPEGNWQHLNIQFNRSGDIVIFLTTAFHPMADIPGRFLTSGSFRDQHLDR
jgi:hypothetical protein